MYLILVIIAISLIFLVAEFLHQRKKVKAEISRKIVHIGNAILIAFLPYLISFKIAIVLGSVLSVVVLILKKKKWLKSVFGIKRKTNGAVIFLPSIILTAFLFWNKEPEIFSISVLILGLSDGFASLIGGWIGKHNLSKKKTLEGSLSFFLTTFLVIFFSFWFLDFSFNFFFLLKIILISLIITLVEAFSLKGWDNLSIPLISSFMIYYFLWI